MDIAGGPVPSIAEQVAQVPTDPGCYLWKDASGQVIYVGKAKNLRARMRQYVTLQDDRQKIPLMMQLVASFDYIVVDNEHEALVLERNLIGQYHPYFNVDYKDDKSYPYIAITKGDVFPAIKYTREKHRPDTRYFGPYTDSRAARATIDTLRKVCPICSASCTEWKRVRRLLEKSPQDADLIGLICAQKGRPCFDYHVGRGPGVCAGMIDADSYAKNVRRVERFLSGQRRDLIADLKEEMSAAAAELDFERAGRVKRRLEVIDGLDDRQQVEALAPDISAMTPGEHKVTVTARGDGEYDFVSRFFSPGVSVPEDPVTGSAHTMLIPYWSEKLRKTTMLARQVSARGGDVRCELKDSRVLMSGQAALYLKGTVFLR